MVLQFKGSMDLEVCANPDDLCMYALTMFQKASCDVTD